MKNVSTKPTASIYKVNSQLTFVLGNKTYTINKHDTFFDKAIEAYKAQDWDTVVSFVDRPQYLIKFSEGRVKVTDGAVLFEDKPIHGYVVDKIINFMESGLPIGPIVRFLDNVQKAKQECVKKDLYLFLEKNDLPLTEDGGFLAYKLVTERGTPYYQTDSDIVYKVGDVIEMPFESCSLSRDECGGPGLYAGNKSYWSEDAFDSKGDFKGDGKMLLVKIMPEWVVSVPESEGGCKLRAHRMQVINEYNTVSRKQTAFVKEISVSKKNGPVRDAFGRFGSSKKPLVFRRGAGGRFVKVGTETSAVARSAKSFKVARDGYGRFLAKGTKPLNPGLRRDAAGRFI